MTTDKVQVGDSTTGTSTSTNYTWKYYPDYNSEKGWECPRCKRINAPWVRQCDCNGNNWTITSDWTYKPEWWKEVTCSPDTFRIHPESGPIWKAPSSVCTSDSNTCKSDNITAYNVKVDNDIYTGNSGLNTGGSDYWNSITKTWENIPSCVTNAINNKMQELQSQINNLKETK